MGSGKVSFKGCFHDTEWGLETHTFVPLGIDIKSKWRIAGNQPDEQRKFNEFRHDAAPKNGLYLQEDIEINCNITLISFVKSQLKAASKVLVDRLIKKAELLDAGVLQAIMEDGRLKTINPADLSSMARSDSLASRRQSDTISLNSYQLPRSPTVSSRQGSVPGASQSKHPLAPPQYGEGKSFAAELPADFHHPQQNIDPSAYRGKSYTAELPATIERPEGYPQSKNFVHELPESR
jgi:hypothetical protein